MAECRERLLRLTQEKKNHKRLVKPHQPTRLFPGSEPVKDGLSGSSGAYDTMHLAAVLRKKRRSEGGPASAFEEGVTARAFNLPPCFMEKDFFKGFHLTMYDAESNIIRRLDDEGRRKHLDSGMFDLMKVAEMVVVLAREGSGSSGLVKELVSEKATLQTKTQKLRSALERSKEKFRV